MEKAIFDDCRKLLANFEKHSKDLTFKSFVKEWQDMKIYCIFGLFTNDNEIICAVQSIMYIAKYILWKDKSIPQRVGALYMLYYIYLKQTTECYVKIEVTLPQLKVFKSFIESLPEDHIQPKAIFAKLIRDNAFRFVFLDVFWGLEEFFNPYGLQSNKGSTVDFQTTRSALSKELTDITEEHNGFLTAFASLEEGYNEMKESLDIPYSSNRICTNLMDGFKQIHDILNNKSASTSKPSVPSMSKQRAIKQKAFTS